MMSVFEMGEYLRKCMHSGDLKTTNQSPGSKDGVIAAKLQFCKISYKNIANK